MKLLLTVVFLVIASAASAQRQYVNEWKRIDSLIEKTGLIKTALKEVNAIYSRAKKENNDVQAIKVLIYRMQLNDELSDSGRYENIALLEKEIASAKEPARSILHSIAGSSYWRYLQTNRWQFYRRSTTKGYDSKDISTWSLEQLYERITAHFDKSISNTKLLQGLKLEKFEPIIIKGNVRYLRPTMFDLLAFKALDYYRNSERYITQPSYAFEISDSNAFAEAAIFAKYSFKTNDSASLHQRALKAYQQLLSFHANDIKHDALIDADLDRLNFVRNFSTREDKDDLYKNALEALVIKFKSEPAITGAIYQLANWYDEKGNRYDPIGDTTNRYAKVRAKALCEQAIAFNVKNEGTANAKNLLNNILRAEIDVKAEQVNTTGEPFRALLRYKNAGTVYVRVVKYGRGINQVEDATDDEFWKRIVALPVIKTYSYNLPATGDYQSHRVEIKIDGLPVGEYGILVSSDQTFALAKNAMALQQVHVSDISYVFNNKSYYVLNRKTGLPLQGAKVQLWQQYYNAAKQRQDIQKLESYTTDANGHFALKKDAGNNSERNFMLDITHGNDRLFIDRPYYNYSYDSEQLHSDSLRNETILFTDRSIYRPGQTVFFKGISITRNTTTSNSSINPNLRSKIILYDANGQSVDSLTLVTNEFGSYSGKFVIPTGLLTGSFSIMEKETNSNVPFRVEEYKRPKFEVKVAAPKGTYRVNDTINVEGSAVSYAGNNINGASVTYRVTRMAMVPWLFSEFRARIWPPFPREQVEIAHGNVITDASGKFKIPFSAIPDRNVPKAAHPVFYYTVTTDVTDINGETRTASTTVNVGYEAMKIELSVYDQMHADSLKEISVVSTNMNDSFERADVKISMYKLNAPAKVFRNRYWEEPDQFTMTKDEYYNNFPYDQYADELNKSKWAKGSAIIDNVFKTAPGNTFKLNKKVTDAGWYVIEALARDKFGDSVFSRKYVLLYNDKLVSPEAGVVLHADKTSAEPGDKVKYSLISNVDGAHIITEKVNIGETITIDEKDRGGIIAKTVFVKNNRVYTDQLLVNVPFTNKQLKIDYTTYRDKSLPGSGEKWKVKISGAKGEKVASELLTSMYDASLDQFAPHAWNFPALWSGSVDNNPWTGGFNFSSGDGVKRDIYEEGVSFVKEYDRLRGDEGGSLVRALAGRIKGVGVQGQGQMQFEKMEMKDAAAPAPPTANAEKKENTNQSPLNNTRKNLNETAFFFPNLKSDAEGDIEFSFTSPEALTTWNWMLLAHTKDLAYAYDTKKIITQKELMVQPNAPRFLREGDNINFSVKVANMSGKTINGTATFELFDPSTGNKVNGLVGNEKQNFNAPAGQSVPLSFSLKIPAVYTQALTWKVIASSEGLSDGEEDIIPVLSNRMLVTETITLPLRNTTSKTFTFDKLLKNGSSNPLKNKALTVEFTSNPAWYAIQALPYLSEVKDENAEQVFNRFYANALASKLANSFPKLKAIIAQWKSSDTSAFLSNLQKNQDLKNILLEETPWVLEAKNESQQKKNIAMLFDVTRMSNELPDALNKLIGMQSEDGSFSWFKGGMPDRYMTQYIVSGIGHLKKLDAIPGFLEERIEKFSRKSLSYLDQQVVKDYRKINQKNKKIVSPGVSFEPIQYLYMRSFFTNIPVPASVTPAINYYRNKVKQDWVKQNTYMRAMIALTLQRSGDQATAKKIVAALKESAIANEELGMYWKDVNGGYFWYQAPVETQSVVIEAFNEITKDNEAIADMKTWLLKNKQTNNWRTTKSTAEAIYAILLDGGSWIADDAAVSIKLGDSTIAPNKTEAGTGYFRKTIDGDAVKPSMGNITVNLKTGNANRPAWGGVYWQYFEDLDKITNAATSLKINKKLFVQKNTDRGPVIEALDNDNTLYVGDRVKVRIEIRNDRNLEYVHLKDMRSSSMEPVNVLSEYRWQDGLGYYESTKDASTNFYFDFLPKGTHVFEYDLFVTNSGTFSNGVATIQCMYAPEFSSHSEGIKVNVVK